MDLSWFRMEEIRRRRYETAAFVPLRASATLAKTGSAGRLDFEEEFFGAGSVAFSVSDRAEVEKLNLHYGDLNRENYPSVGQSTYAQSDVFEDNRADFVGVSLVLEQTGNRVETMQWHLHQDLVIALHLLRGGDNWLSIEEGYTVVARAKTRRPAPPVTS